MPVVGDGESLAKGTTPILVRWDYLALADRDQRKSTSNIKVVVPKSGVIGGVYVQGISVNAPHPNAAKLWMDTSTRTRASLPGSPDTVGRSGSRISCRTTRFQSGCWSDCRRSRRTTVAPRRFFQRPRSTKGPRTSSPTDGTMLSASRSYARHLRLHRASRRRSTIPRARCRRCRSAQVRFAILKGPFGLPGMMGMEKEDVVSQANRPLTPRKLATSGT